MPVTYSFTEPSTNYNNAVQTALVLSTSEDTVTVSLSGVPRTICFMADVAWGFSLATGAYGTKFQVAAGQPINIQFQNSTPFLVQGSAAGNLRAYVVQ